MTSRFSASTLLISSLPLPPRIILVEIHLLDLLIETNKSMGALLASEETCWIVSMFLY